MIDAAEYSRAGSGRSARASAMVSGVPASGSIARASSARNAAGTADVEEARSGRDPEQLEAEAAQVREQEQRITAEVDAHRVALEEAVTGRRSADQSRFVVALPLSD